MFKNSKPLKNNVYIEIDDPYEEDKGIYIKTGQPASDLYGTVKAVGPEVADLKPGDRVMVAADVTRYLNIKLLIIQEDDVVCKIED